jgi:hypothetical protein
MKEIGSEFAARHIDQLFPGLFPPVLEEDETGPTPTPPRRSRRIQAASTDPDPNPMTPPRRSDPPAASPSSPVSI